jgi:hypothetical protein
VECEGPGAIRRQASPVSPLSQEIFKDCPGKKKPPEESKKNYPGKDLFRRVNVSDHENTCPLCESFNPNAKMICR